MADDETREGGETPATPAAQAPAAPAQGQPQGQPQGQEVKLDETQTVASYANFCRVTGTPEELIVDFGLNPQPMGVPHEPLKITQRIIVNFFTAKRLLGALHVAVQRHEAAFGVLETDVQRRVRPQAMRQQSS